MRLVNITASQNILTPDTTNAGQAGDYLNTRLDIKLDPELSSSGYTYLLIFQTSKQKRKQDAYITEKLYPTEGIISFYLPSCLMIEGALEVQLKVIETESERIVYSPICMPSLYISHSLMTQEAELKYRGMIEDIILKFLNLQAVAETKNAGESATAELLADKYSYKLILGIPQGIQGIQGIKGDKGDKGEKGGISYIVSSTMPQNQVEGDVWLNTSTS